MFLQSPCVFRRYAVRGCGGQYGVFAEARAVKEEARAGVAERTPPPPLARGRVAAAGVPRRAAATAAPWGACGGREARPMVAEDVPREEGLPVLCR